MLVQFDIPWQKTIFHSIQLIFDAEIDDFENQKFVSKLKFNMDFRGHFYIT